MKPSPARSESLLSHCVHVLVHGPSGCDLQLTRSKRSSVHPEGPLLHSTGEKLWFSFPCPLHSNIMVQFLRNHITLLPRSIKNVRNRILVFLIAPEHLTHPGSICLMRQPLTFLTKAYSEHAPEWELPTRGTNRSTERTFHILRNPAHGVCKDPTLPKSGLPCQPRLTHVLHPWALTDQNPTDWMQKSFFPLILPVWQALSVWWTLQLHLLKTYGLFANTIAQIHGLDTCCQHWNLSFPPGTI